MAFPKKPGTEDERRAEFLRLAGVPEYPGVYVLGCFAGYVTVHAQQVRALNLIDCLAKHGVLSGTSQVAVIGGGIAGLTAAAAAAVRGVRRVVVFERKDDLLTVQRTSEQRYIHPHIYDWPVPNALVDDKGLPIDDAGLPILNWKAESAADVVRQLLEKWGQVIDSNSLPGRIEVRTCCGELKIPHTTSGPEVWSGGRGESFNTVILAVGFGRDAQFGTDSYWTDSRIDGQEATEEGEWLVSGGGDGALTDLMRLCISGFRHKQVLEAVDENARRKVGDDLLRAESENLPLDQLAARYRQAAASIAPMLEGKLKRRSIKKVWLNCSEEELFRPRSSRLNRLICAWLLNEERFETVPMPGPILEPRPMLDGRYEIPFKNPVAEHRVVRHAILRHGPRKDTKLGASFPNIYSACVDIEAEWHSARQDDDWTKEPLYENREFGLGTGGIPPLRVDFDARVGCIVIGRGTALKGASLKKRVELALIAFNSRYAKLSGLAVDLEPVEFSVTEVFGSPVAYERMVRALCYSPIAIVDITGNDPAVLLLLGIRAAARRGITVTVTEEAPSGRKLPFNIGALNPVHLGTESAKGIARALRSGFESLKAQPNVYLDLPAYDALRKLGEDHRVLEPEKQILFLRWFDQQYTDLVKELVEAPLQNAFDEATLVTTLDSRSPQLVEQRLYAAIRRTRLCIADWTAWRPNVFFEIGVRLAVNETDPICIRCADKPPGWNDEAGRWPDQPKGTADLLTAFFQPTTFTLENDGDLRTRFSLFVDERSTRQPQAQISPGFTYRIVSESIDRRQEAGGTPVHDTLLAEAKALAGEPVVESGDSIPVLFADALSEQARTSAVEYVLAAWFYLNGRYKLLEKRDSGKELSQADRLLLEELEKVWGHLSALLRKVQIPQYEELRITLLKAMDRET